ncbi:hypothetical protein HI914_07492 [Erysiphe necator]|nr:hypothetical protein HI914_07492 [Erysiphe necator]
MFIEGKTRMRLLVLFVILIVHFNKTFAVRAGEGLLSDSVENTASPDRNDEKGYECGDVSFTVSETQEALQMYLQYMNQKAINIPQGLHVSPHNDNAQQIPNFQDSNILQEYSTLQDYRKYAQDFNGPQKSYTPEWDSTSEIDSNTEKEKAPLKYKGPIYSNEDSSEYSTLQEYRKYVQESSRPQKSYAPESGSTPEIDFNTKMKKPPLKYKGPLYSDESSSEYFLWPIGDRKLISQSNTYDSFFIVIKKNGKNIIDVIARIANGEYTKCIRRDSLLKNLPISIPGRSNGYQCAHELLSYDLIQVSLNIAVKSLLYNKHKYPSKYFGNLYKNPGWFLLWPIFHQRKFYKQGSGKVEPYFLILNKEGEFIDVVVEGLMNNFIRCQQTRKISTELISDAPNQLVPSQISGYQCGKFFFSNEELENTANVARDIMLQRSQNKIPTKYNGPLFDERVILWPLLPKEKIYKSGPMGNYRIVLSTSLQRIIGTVMWTGREFKKCDTRKILVQINHDLSDYLCNKNVILNQQLVKAAMLGCDGLKKSRYSYFPSKYEGPSFEKNGPYFTFPVLPKGEYKKFAGPDRVVFNTNCEVVGAITIFTRPSSIIEGAKFVKCPKICVELKDISYMNDPNKPIFEHRLGF